ncbi:hypothetical protein [Roseicella aquatilis]|uniref:Uncharacterized protein n=1 Tax=Roseicella aquatilis TaxID=2527868 RepID=A0A4R4DC55_9PROT|nr:hypothetical protein [Roseicella aquatilis]TCZ57804.1 hypothetical protein EXY23_17730 [Roseicella aquatilis]
MIATHSLSAFTPAVNRPGDAQPVRSVTPGAAVQGKDATTEQQRTLGTVPAEPSRPLPRGSLLDLRV